MVIDPVISLIFSLVLSYIFVAAAVHKLQDFGEFRETITNYRVIPDRLVTPFAVILPLAELAAGIGLLVPFTASVAAVAVALLLLVYILAMSINLAQGRRSIDCGCGGSEQKQYISEWLVLRNALLVVFACCIVVDGPVRELAWFDWLVAFLGTTVICLIYNILNQLLVNRDLLKVLKNHA